MTTLTSTPRRIGPYEIVELIGAGSMGLVYKAHDPRLDRDVALKTLQDSSVNERILDRFRQAAQSAAKVEQPRIVAVYDFGLHEGQPFYTMRLVEGSTLQAMLDTLGDDQRQAAELLAMVAEAVGGAHRAGVIHGDLKPSSILLDATNTPYVADFGHIEADGLPLTGERLGTFQYIAPEQALDARNGSPASDVYSLGVILYQVLTGKLPSTRQESAEPEHPRHRNGQPVHPQLAAVCLKCLERPPEARYENALELAEELRRFLEGRRVPPRNPRRWWWRALIVVVVGSNLVLSWLGAFGLLSGVLFKWQDESARFALTGSVLLVSSVGALILILKSQSLIRRLSARNPRKWWWRALIAVVVGLNLLESIFGIWRVLSTAAGLRQSDHPPVVNLVLGSIFFVSSFGALMLFSLNGSHAFGQTVRRNPRKWWWPALTVIVAGLNLLFSVTSLNRLVLAGLGLGEPKSLMSSTLFLVSSVATLILIFESQSRRRRVRASKPRKSWRALTMVVVVLNVSVCIYGVWGLIFAANGGTPAPDGSPRPFLDGTILLLVGSVGALILIFESESRRRASLARGD